MIDIRNERVNKMGVVNEKSEMPLHSGEIYHLWSHLLKAKQDLVTIQIFINHTGDKDLKALLEDFLENSVKYEEEQTESILSQNGIRLPPAPPARPEVNLQDIPAGARFNEPEIAHLVLREISIGKMECSFIIGLAHRVDLIEMFDEFHGLKMEYSDKLLTLTKEKGWLTDPPILLK